MKLQKQPNNWSCLPTAFAMALDMDVKNLINLLGHDGSEIIWPDKKEPFNRRSFHIQEFIDFCYSCDYAIIQIDNYFKSQPDNFSKPFVVMNQNFEKIIYRNIGVLIGIGNQSSRNHAVAWNGIEIFDPNGSIYKLQDMEISDFYCLRKLQ